MTLKIKVHERLNEAFNPKAVKIGNQVWMADNLDIDDGGEGIYYNPQNKQYYYTWDAAVRVANTITGWHLPSQREWKTLFTAVGGQSTAGKVLKSTVGWKDDGNGTDDFGFSALPAGDRYYDGNFYYDGSNAFFWSSTEYGSNYAYNMYLGYDGDYAFLGNDYKDFGLSVRLIKG